MRLPIHRPQGRRLTHLESFFLPIGADEGNPRPAWSTTYDQDGSWITIDWQYPSNVIPLVGNRLDRLLGGHLQENAATHGDGSLVGPVFEAVGRPPIMSENG